MPKNTVADLNDILFDQLERLMYPEEEDDMDELIKVSKAVSNVAKNIIDNHRNMLDAVKLQQKQDGYIDTKSTKVLLGMKDGEN